jgi:hypothetical protein
MSIMEAVGTILIIAMHPAQNRLFLPVDLVGPLTGLFLAAADHIQGLKAFAAPGMVGIDGQAPQIVGLLVPFFKVWPDHCSAPSFRWVTLFYRLRLFLQSYVLIPFLV